MNSIPAGPNQILRYFSFEHLPFHLQRVSKPIHTLANSAAASLPAGPELSAGLRKLLEAKDCFVRAALDVPAELHTITQAERDNAAVMALADAQASKLSVCRLRGKAGWEDLADCPQQHLSNLLHKAVAAGHTVDVANYCAFLFNRAEAILPPGPVVVQGTEDATYYNERFGENYGTDWVYPNAPTA